MKPKQKQNDDKFEQYRKERKLRRTTDAAASGIPKPGGGVGRLLDAAEAKEAHEQRLTREVHEFFANATRTAATIMERFCERATTENIGRITDDMQEFLRQAIMRAQAFMQKLASEGPTREAERHMLAKMHNIVGPLLDEFRAAGTAAVRDRHFGKDPFSVSSEPAPSPRCIDDHIVAEVVGKYDDDDDQPAPKKKAELPAHPLLAGIGADPERLKKALKLLVEGGIMAKSEAKRIWEARAR